jgi:predicted ATPase
MRELGEQCLTLAQHLQDPTFLLWGHGVLGITLWQLVEFAPAATHLARSIALYDVQQHQPLYVGTDPGVLFFSYAAITLWHLGYSDQALQRSRETLTLAHQRSHSFSLAQALNYAALLHQYRREVGAARTHAETALELSHAQGFTQRLAVGMIHRGWALAMQGQGDEGIAEIRRGISAWQATGAEIALPYYLSMLTEALGKSGRTEEGLPVLTEALAWVDKHGERYYEAELYRLKGELLRHAEEAEVCFRQALAVACRQQAKSWELRAATSLARLWQQQGKRAEAHHLLAPIYGWFTEGFDTADLQEGKALLEALT